MGPRLCATRGGHRPLSRRPRTRSRRREGQSKRWCKPERLLSASRLAAIGCHCARQGQTFSSVVTEGRRRGRRPHPQRAAAAVGGHEQHASWRRGGKSPTQHCCGKSKKTKGATSHRGTTRGSPNWQKELKPVSRGGLRSLAGGLK